MNEKVKTARLSIFSNIFLIAMKLAIGIVGGSVSIISEAIHSGIDLIASVIAYFSVRISDTPPDKEHPYGHGKYENVSGVIEAILIFFAAGIIIYEAIDKLEGKSQINSLGLGSLVMVISAIVNTYVSRKLYKIAKKTDSIALEADALHLKTDVYTSLGVAIGLLLIWLTKWYILDPIIALCVALLILKESYSLLKNAFYPLLDISLSDDEIKIITEVIVDHKLQFHSLKTRKSGQFKFAEMHLEMPADIKLKEAHDTCDNIEKEIQQRIQNIEVNIHVEPV
ncbi:MAG: cation transporter [Bacteroidales bacterium]|nr:cation transporter [Bacteroidales bacterium]